MAHTISSERLKQLIAQIKKEKTPSEVSNTSDSKYVTYDKYGNLITYNKSQSQFMDLSSSGKSCVLIGSAGTGKTTCMRGTIENLLQSKDFPLLTDSSPHKHLIPGSPGIVIIAYTRIAVSNIRKALSSDMKQNCLTYHKLMEYAPVYDEVTDPETGETKTRMMFIASRHAGNPLPKEIQTIVIEESSMFSVEYYEELLKALPHPVQFIFLGDINQLPPVFGSAILGFKMLELPLVELTEVYRQALDSPIISLATNIKNGITRKLDKKEILETSQGTVTFHPWQKKLHPEDALFVSAKFFTTAIGLEVYNPDSDMILCPFNKALGTIELNKHIANFLAKKRKAIVYEIVAGFAKHYFSVGDKVLYDKMEARITDIKTNPEYSGVRPQSESPYLDYWGTLQFEDTASSEHHLKDETDEDVDFILEQMASSKDEDRVHQCSHIITVRLEETEQEIKISKASDINTLLLAYVLTVHKAQGSEWDKVFLLFHHSHATMLSRELLYTAVTRAKEELYIISEKDTFISGVRSQRIKGTTLKEKAEVFKGKLETTHKHLKGK